MMTECPFGFYLESEVEAEEEGGWYGGRQEANAQKVSQVWPMSQGSHSSKSQHDGGGGKNILPELLQWCCNGFFGTAFIKQKV